MQSWVSTLVHPMAPWASTVLETSGLIGWFDNTGHFYNGLVPRLSPSLFLVRMRKGREGESLGGFDHMRTLMTRSVSITASQALPLPSLTHAY